MVKGLCFGTHLIISLNALGIEAVLWSSMKEIASARFSAMFMYPCLRFLQ